MIQKKRLSVFYTGLLIVIKQKGSSIKNSSECVSVRIYPNSSLATFLDHFTKFKQDCNLPKRKPFESFWSALQNQDSNMPENIAHLKKAASKSKKNPGAKCVRSPFWGEFKLLSDILDKQDDTTRYLLSEKIYRRSQDRDSDDLDYIFDAYGIPEDMRSVNELRMYVKSINQLLETDIEILEGYLQRIPELETKKPQVLKWVVGYMGHHISKYLPNWESYYQKQNRRKKPYKQFREKLVRFLNGATPMKLGYTTKTWHNFTETDGLKGIASLLIEAYDILYGQNAVRETREKMIEEMSQKVRNVFKESDRD